jgi:hypothetical protein
MSGRTPEPGGLAEHRPGAGPASEPALIWRHAIVSEAEPVTNPHEPPANQPDEQTPAPMPAIIVRRVPPDPAGTRRVPPDVA